MIFVALLWVLAASICLVIGVHSIGRSGGATERWMVPLVAWAGCMGVAMAAAGKA